MSSTNRTPEQKARNAESQRRYRLKHPKKMRELNKINSRKHREKNKEANHEYQNAYFKKWRSNPLNALTHRIRNLSGYLKTYYLKRDVVSPTYVKIWENLHEVGWSTDLDDSYCVNHRISIKLLLTFKIDLSPEIIYAVENIEVIKKIDNNKAQKRRVTRDTIRLAHKLEKLYPVALGGLEAFVGNYKGRII